LSWHSVRTMLRSSLWTTGLPAVAYGGFLGTDNALTLAQLKQLVKEGKITYFLVSSEGGHGRLL
jgi:aryl-alcohol dehydrogenase-like predicted oxidoreductase